MRSQQYSNGFSGRYVLKAHVATSVGASGTQYGSVSSGSQLGGRGASDTPSSQATGGGPSFGQPPRSMEPDSLASQRVSSEAGARLSKQTSAPSSCSRPSLVSSLRP